MEPAYLDLSRSREESVRKHQEIMSRLLEAEVSKELELQHKGERFSLIDPPELPEQPEKPNRPVIMFLGLVLAIAGGIGSGAVLEQLDRSIRGGEHLSRLAGLPPLAVIPYVPNQDDLQRLVRQRVRVAVAGAGVGGAAHRVGAGDGPPVGCRLVGGAQKARPRMKEERFRS